MILIFQIRNEFSTKMPFVQRVVQPVYVSRPSQHEQKSTAVEPFESKSHTNDEFNFIANFTLSNVLRQLASVLLVADGILGNLNEELKSIRTRSERLKERIRVVGHNVEQLDATVVGEF